MIVNVNCYLEVSIDDCNVSFLGCTKLQIRGTVGYLNSQLDGIHWTYHVNKYALMLNTHRDVLEPRHKYMTREKGEKPYLWLPQDFTEAVEMTEQVVDNV